MARLNRDLLNLVPAKQAAGATMGLVDRLQEYPPHLQVVALAATFKLYMERHKITPFEAFTVADNIMIHATGKRVEFDAVRAYMEHEV